MELRAGSAVPKPSGRLRSRGSWLVVQVFDPRAASQSSSAAPKLRRILVAAHRGLEALWTLPHLQC